MLKYIILFLMQINAFSQTKIGPQELSQPFVIVSSNTKQQALVIDNDYNIANGYNFVVSTMGYIGIGVLQPKAMLDINVNPNQQYALVIDTNNNPSDGYILSVSTNGFVDFFQMAISTFGKVMTSPDVEAGYVKIGNICIESGRTIQTTARTNGIVHYFPYPFKSGTTPYVVVSLDSLGGAEGYVIRTRNITNTQWQEAWDSFNSNAASSNTSIRWIAFGLCQ
jgi:hypothetical protein